MASQTYMYLNNGTKVPVYGNTDTHSMPYRAYVTETTSKKNSTKKSSGSTALAADNSSAQMAEAMRAQREAEEKRAAEEARRRKEKINAINSSKAVELKRLGDNYSIWKQEAKQNNEDNLRQLYIAYMQGLRGIPQQSAVWGAGGEIESLKNRTRLNYESNRAKENRNYSGILGDIQQKYNDDLAELERKYLQQLLNV